MARYENGRGSERFYNPELNNIFELLKYLTYDMPPEEDTIINNALTYGGINRNELLYRKNGSWEILFKDKFKLIDEMLEEERPSDPVVGQMWLDNGVLTYWNGFTWELVKTAFESEYSINAYEQFLLIDDLQKGLNLIVNTHKTYIEETFIIRDTISSVTLLKGTYEPNNNKIAIYINGRFVNSTLYVQTDDHTITFVSPLTPSSESTLTIQYLPKNSIENNNYFIRFNNDSIQEVFSPSIDQTSFSLTKGSFLINKNQVEVYVDGRYVSHNSYIETNSTTITLKAAPVTNTNPSNVEVVIIYINSIPGPTDYQEVVAENTLSQIVWPSSNYDRLFIDGENSINYRAVNNVTIELETNNLIEHHVAALHINPKNISGIEKKIFKVSAINSYIPVPTATTEVYGINSNYGKLLMPDTDTLVKDYNASPSGITLNQHTIDNYDFIMTVTYYFKTTNGRGQLIKGSLDMIDNSSFFVGITNEPIAIFYHGMALTNETDYHYDRLTGCVQLNNSGEIGKIDIGVISFPKIYYGQVETENQIVIPFDTSESNHFKNVIIFVNGLAISYSVTSSSADEVFEVKGATIGMQYVIVECTENDGIKNMFVKSGTVTTYNNESYIPLPDSIINENVIVIIDGLLISKNDVKVDYSTRKIFINHLSSNQKYILLKDIGNRYMFSNYITHNCVALPKAVNNLMLYTDGKALVDFEEIAVPAAPTEPAKENEIRCTFTRDSNGVVIPSTWYIYNNNAWTVVEDTEKYDTQLLGFILDSNIFSLLNSELQNRSYTFYGYQYDYAIENPLISLSTITSSENKTEPAQYYTGFNGYYKLKTNALSVYVDGIRQYPYKSNFKDGVKEISNSVFELSTGYEENLPILCIIERLEGNEQMSCDNQILYANNLIVGSSNLFSTNIILTPGVVRVFIGGLRISSEKIKVIGRYTLEIAGYVVTKDPILLEVRNDYSLKEQLIKARINGQNRFTVDEDNIQESLIESGDLITIFVNGYRYQGTYKIDKSTNSIILQDNNFYDRIKIQDQIIFEWR